MVYTLDVYCRRNGVSQDAGTEFIKELKDDTQALSELHKSLAWLGRFYDEVYYTLKRSDGVVVAKS